MTQPTEWEPAYIGAGKRAAMQAKFDSGAEYRACPGKFEGAGIKNCEYCTNLNTRLQAENPHGITVFYCKYKADHFSNMNARSLKLIELNDCHGFCNRGKEEE